MKRLAALALAAGLIAMTAPAPANAQNRMMNPDCNILCAPVFVAQPGVVISNFISKPSGVESSTEFLARVTTAFPTQFNPLFIVALVQWTPFADCPADELLDFPDCKANEPAFVYGPGFHILGGASTFVDMGRASDYVSFDLLPLLVYSVGCRTACDPGGDNSHYTHKLTPEADLFLHIGKIIDPNNRAPYINGISFHALLDYVSDAFGRVTIADASDQGYKHWVLVLGATMPIAPIPGGS
jgi:hypothetical protein